MEGRGAKEAGVSADSAEAVLAALDPEQRQVALATRGPVCVLAGAGTGKTRAVAHRIAYAVRTGAADPGHVLAVTFTTRAAGELRARLRQLAVPGDGMERVQASTFHAAALRQLTHFWPVAVGGRPPGLLGTKAGLLREAAAALAIKAGPAELRDVAAEIEWAKVTQVRPEDYPAAAAKAGRTPPLEPERTGRLYACYERLRRERHLADFESVLELCAGVLIAHPGLAAEVRDRYRYFVVDEYQDVNPLQKLLLDAWLGDRDDICVVGDPWQTIYSFAGATPAYLTSFTAEFPDAAVVRLVRSYRSTPQVIALANWLTSQACPGMATARRASLTGRPARPAAAGAAGAGEAKTALAGVLVAQRPAGPEPEFTGYEDEQAEAQAVAARAAQLIRSGLPPRQIAVLVRTNGQTAVFEAAFAEAGVPCQVRGAERFFARPEVRQAVGLLRAALKSAQAGGTGPGPAMAAEVRDILAAAGLTREPPARRGAARERWESLAALAQLAEDFAAARPGADLAAFAAELSHRMAIEHAPELEGVTIASLHAAKGLEWDAVFLPGLTDGNLPIAHAQTGEDIEEERRLLYVGVTRAREHLFLSWPLARSRGGPRTRVPSPFLAGLPQVARPGPRGSGALGAAAARPGLRGSGALGAAAARPGPRGSGALGAPAARPGLRRPRPGGAAGE
jgi:DNA helicase-2/ATP-dependent DNA helicase PcrA